MLTGIMLHKLNTPQLLVLFAVLAFFLLYYRVTHLLNMLLRMRWLFVSIFLIYGFSTPGEYLNFSPFDIALTYEGLREGALQITRLGLMLAAIALLMKTTPREDLIAGFYCLIWPLRAIGLSPERFASRLCLTLQYLENSRADNSQSAGDAWKRLLSMGLDESPMNHDANIITLTLPAIKMLDYFVLATLLISLAVWAWVS